MNKNSILFGIGGLVIGLVIGFFATNALNRAALSQSPAGGNQSNLASMLEHGAPDASGAPAGGMLGDVQAKLDKAKSEPNNFVAQMQAGDMYTQIGKPDKAIEFYESGVKINPSDMQANLVLANSYFDTKQFENAEKHYAKVLEINPKDVNARTDLATTLVERQNPDYERAIAEFQKALEINASHEPTLYNLGVAYSRKGDAENAQKTLARLEQANPNSQLVARLRQILAQK